MLIRDNLLVSIIVLNKKDKNQVILKKRHFFMKITSFIGGLSGVKKFFG